MKNIMFFLANYNGGGAERTLLNLVRNIDKNKFNVTLVILNIDMKVFDYKELVPNNINIIRLNSKRLRYSLLDLINVIRKHRPHLMFTTLVQPNIILVLAKMLSFTNVKVVVREANNRGNSDSLSNLNKVLTRFFYNRADAVISLSNGVKNDLVETFKVKSSKIHVIYNPVDITLIQDMLNEDVDDFVNEKDVKYIIAVGRLHRQKNYKLLIDAYSEIKDKINVELLILGKGEDEKVLKDYVSSMKLEKYVHFLGFKTNPYKYMKLADSFVLTSKWEGFAHVVAEALCVGLPVISTNCPSGPAEILENGKYGTLVESNNTEELSKAMIETLTKDNLDNIKKGFCRVKDFDAKKIIKDYENVFESLVN